MRPLALTLGVVAVAALVAISCKGGGGDQPPDGKQLFDSVCARCHGVSGVGDPTARAQLGVPDMTLLDWQRKHTDEDIKKTVHQGSTSKKMPPFGEYFSPPQLDAIVKHVRALGERR